MIVVTGQPRCGTSMMCHCLHKAGVPLAFDENKGRDVKAYRNPYGFYEGRWNGNDGLLKALAISDIKALKDVRIVYMYRNPEKVEKSWEAVNKQMKHQPNYDKKLRRLSIEKKFEVLDTFVQDYPHVKVNYDTFVTNPEEYREVFITLFPELDYDIIISGIDRYLYINR